MKANLWSLAYCDVPPPTPTLGTRSLGAGVRGPGRIVETLEPRTSTDLNGENRRRVVEVCVFPEIHRDETGPVHPERPDRYGGT